MEYPRLELLFANQDALVDVLGIGGAEQTNYLSAPGESQRQLAQKQHLLAIKLEESLKTSPPPELQRVVLDGSAAPGQIVSVEQAFYFGRQRLRRRVRFHAALNTDSDWRVEGLVDPDRFPFSSTHDHLSGRRNVFIVATIGRITGHEIELRALFIGHRT